MLQIYRYEEVTSTNDVAKTLAREGQREAVIIASIGAIRTARR